MTNYDYARVLKTFKLAGELLERLKDPHLFFELVYVHFLNFPFYKMIPFDNFNFYFTKSLCSPLGFFDPTSLF